MVISYVGTVLFNNVNELFLIVFRRIANPGLREGLKLRQNMPPNLKRRKER